MLQHSKLVFISGNHFQPSLNFQSKISGLYYKHIMIVNYDSSIVSKLGASLTDDARIVIYNHYMFIVQATDSTQVEHLTVPNPRYRILALPQNIELCLNEMPGDEQSSLLRLLRLNFNDKKIKFYQIDTWTVWKAQSLKRMFLKYFIGSVKIGASALAHLVEQSINDPGANPIDVFTTVIYRFS
jgi:hypothetical protein